MKLQIASLLLITLGMGCQPSPKAIGDYPDVKAVFHEEEIRDLAKIIAFFNEAICKSEHLDNSNVLACYERYFRRMQEAEETGNLAINIPRQEQETLLREISPGTFEQIWAHGKAWAKGTDTLDILNIKPEGKFMAFLQAYGKANPKAKDYAEKFEVVGDISPSMIADVLINHQAYDVRDERMKLLIAVHYLTLNGQYQ